MNYLNRFYHPCEGVKLFNIQNRQRKGFLIQPVVTDESLIYLPSMVTKVGSWLVESGKETMIVELPDQWVKSRDYLLENVWKRQYTWLELVCWLDDRARQKFNSL